MKSSDRGMELLMELTPWATWSSRPWQNFVKCGWRQEPPGPPSWQRILEPWSLLMERGRRCDWWRWYWKRFSLHPKISHRSDHTIETQSRQIRLFIIAPPPSLPGQSCLRRRTSRHSERRQSMRGSWAGRSPRHKSPRGQAHSRFQTSIFLHNLARTLKFMKTFN